MFKWDYIICKNQCFEVREIFDYIHLQMIYDHMSEWSLNTIEYSFIEHRNNQWKELLPSKSNICTYLKFKDTIYTEMYVKYCSFKKRRSRNMKPEERLCFICNTNDIEDEQHVACV